ncbi:hypothetical protein [Polaromonas aquatica]|uniref:hypothetical protein n=1 Tax=Polaromonas aquatica TaxID=332657 RepID=UPI003D661733
MLTMEILNLLQWPAMAVTVTAAWLVGSNSKRKRHWGFWVYLLSNLLWVAWGWHAQAYALIALQFCLAAMNIRGARKTDTGDKGAL